MHLICSFASRSTKESKFSLLAIHAKASMREHGATDQICTLGLKLTPYILVAASSSLSFRPNHHQFMYSFALIFTQSFARNLCLR